MTRRFPVSSCTSSCGKLVVAGRSAHQADVRSLFENLLAFLLGDASQHRKRFALAMFFLELVEPVEHLLFGFIADAAGVVEDQLGFFGRLDLLIALMEQRADDLLRIVRVHLAPEGLDVEGLHSIFIVREPRRLRRSPYCRDSGFGLAYRCEARCETRVSFCMLFVRRWRRPQSATRRTRRTSTAIVSKGNPSQLTARRAMRAHRALPVDQRPPGAPGTDRRPRGQRGRERQGHRTNRARSSTRPASSPPPSAC